MESKGFKLSGSKTQCLECKFNEGEEEVIDEVIISVTLISKVDKFKYLDSIIKCSGRLTTTLVIV